jgi:hypothetical protein
MGLFRRQAATEVIARIAKIAEIERSLSQMAFDMAGNEGHRFSIMAIPAILTIL